MPTKQTIVRTFILSASDVLPTRIRAVSLQEERSIIVPFDHASNTPEEDAVRALIPGATAVEYTHATERHSFYRVIEEEG